MITNYEMAQNLICREVLHMPIKEKLGGWRMRRRMAIGELIPEEEYTGNEEYVELTPEQLEWAQDLLTDD